MGGRSQERTRKCAARRRSFGICKAESRKVGKEKEPEMMITVHLSDGRKITKDEERLEFFSNKEYFKTVGMPRVGNSKITINLDHVVDMRPAEPDEIKHAEIHGW